MVENNSNVNNNNRTLIIRCDNTLLYTEIIQFRCLQNTTNEVKSNLFGFYQFTIWRIIVNNNISLEGSIHTMDGFLGKFLSGLIIIIIGYADFYGYHGNRQHLLGVQVT